MTNENERLFSMLIYLLSFVFPIVAPLVIWIVKKDESDFVDYHGREYFNFFISYAIYTVISFILVIILIGFLLLFALGILAVVFTIVAAIKAFEGERYRIPFTIRFFN